MPNKSFIKCTSLKNHSSVGTREWFHFSKSLLAEEGGVRRLSRCFFSPGFLASEDRVVGGPDKSVCRRSLVDDPSSN